MLTVLKHGDLPVCIANVNVYQFWCSPLLWGLSTIQPWWCKQVQTQPSTVDGWHSHPVAVQALPPFGIPFRLREVGGNRVPSDADATKLSPKVVTVGMVLKWKVVHLQSTYCWCGKPTMDVGHFPRAFPLAHHTSISVCLRKLTSRFGDDLLDDF